jgi:hypothetical protein
MSGAIKQLSNGKDALIMRLEEFEKLCQPPISARAVLAELATRGLLIKDRGGKNTRQIQISGMRERHRYVCLDVQQLATTHAATVA